MISYTVRIHDVHEAAFRNQVHLKPMASFGTSPTGSARQLRRTRDFGSPHSGYPSFGRVRDDSVNAPEILWSRLITFIFEQQFIGRTVCVCTIFCISTLIYMAHTLPRQVISTHSELECQSDIYALLICNALIEMKAYLQIIRRYHN